MGDRRGTVIKDEDEGSSAYLNFLEQVPSKDSQMPLSHSRSFADVWPQDWLAFIVIRGTRQPYAQVNGGVRLNVLRSSL